MGKLFVFGIGGTGARVLRSFAMLLAAGVECGADRVIPVLIDRDTTNGDLKRMQKAFNKYCAIREFKSGDGENVLRFDRNDGLENRFFSTCIEKPVFENNACEFVLPIDAKNQTFRRFIGEDTIHNESIETKALINTLFSDENLDMELEVGFKGNPNIGCVVLNRLFDQSKLFKLFANFEENDRIFIISSIFGGTGSSGFPLLLKMLRDNRAGIADASAEFPKSDLVRQACIGAVTVMPYFQVMSGPTVNSNTFISKAIAAMEYYNNDIIGKTGAYTQHCVDYLYSIAGDMNEIYEHNEGGIGQENNAHFVELASALAICDFMQVSQGLKPSEVHVTKKLRFGIETDRKGRLSFDDLSKDTLTVLRKPFTQMWMFTKYIKEKFEKRFDTLPTGKTFKPEFFKGGFYKELEDFLKLFDEYLLEMSNSFAPYSSAGEDDFFLRIEGVQKEKNTGISLNANLSGWNLYETEINKLRATQQGKHPARRLLEIFWRATRGSINKRLKHW